MFVTVKYGEKEEGIFNPQCKCITLLSNIKDRCCKDDVEVDLSDESGNIKNLRDTPNRYADEMLVDRETLILLRVDRADSGDCRFIPLLNDNGSITDNFMAQLADGTSVNSRPSSRRSRNAKKTKLKTDQKDQIVAKNGKPVATNTQPRGKPRLK